MSVICISRIMQENGRYFLGYIKMEYFFSFFSYSVNTIII